MGSLTCTHCLGPVSPGQAITEKGGAGSLVFCCPACQAIYHLINHEGLDRFYRERDGWQPGKPEIASPAPAAFQVRTDNGAAEVDLVLAGLRCSSCVWLIEKFLARAAGVLEARVNYATHRARVRWDPTLTDLSAILNRITSLGYSPAPYLIGAGDQSLERERKSLLIRLATAGFFSFQVMLLSIVLYEGYFRGIDPWTRRAIGFVLWGLATPVVFYGGYPFIRNTLRGLRVGAVSMDTLVFLGSMSAYLYSVFSLSRDGEVYFDTAAMIITLILLGRFLETGARRKASEAISALMGLQPAEARAVRQDEAGRESVVLVETAALAPGDLIEVRPGDIIPFDCRVLEGESEVDESMLTGEALPVFKQSGAEVYSGTTNLGGRLRLLIRKAGSETVLAGIIKAVEEAQAAKAPVERLADRVTVWFVPAILVTAGATFFFWHSLGSDTTTALMHAISVLVIACPCALGLATPMAILTGSSRASRQGLLIRGGDVLEAVSKTDTVAFDKTGTITTGRPVLAGIISYEATEADALKTAAALEQYSEHTIAKAILKAAGGKGFQPVSRFKTRAGKGVEGLVENLPVILGSPGFLRERNVSLEPRHKADLQELAATGGTVVGLARNHKIMAWFCVSDSLRSEAPQVVAALRRSGCSVALLTGDSREAALHAARGAGIDESEVYPGATPLEKAEIIRELRGRGRRVLMVGDGINDAPALTEADAGAAMGRATDVAIRSAGVVLMREDLNLVVRLLDISSRTFATIKQNLFWAFSYNLVTVPLAVAGRIHPIISAALMAASSLLVVANSLRLRR